MMGRRADTQPLDPDAAAPLSLAERLWVSDRVRARRIETQTALAAALGVSRSQVTKVLSRARPATPRLRRRLLAVLGGDGGG
jgi:plasmid maintenance system antidote protein VapI